MQDHTLQKEKKDKDAPGLNKVSTWEKEERMREMCGTVKTAEDDAFP